MPKEITVEIFWGNRPFETLTEEEKEKMRQQISERLSKRMSIYYTAHPEEFQKL